MRGSGRSHNLVLTLDLHLVLAGTSGPPRWRLPHVTVVDSPQFDVRGVMVDAAREYLPLSALKSYVVLCRVYVTIPHRLNSRMCF